MPSIGKGVEEIRVRGELDVSQVKIVQVRTQTR